MDGESVRVEAELAGRAQPSATLLHFLGPPGRAKLVCAVVLAQPNEKLWLRRLGRVTQLGFAGLHRELQALEQMRIIRRVAQGGARMIEVDETHPMVLALRALIAAADLTEDFVAIPKWRIDHQKFIDRCNAQDS